MNTNAILLKAEGELAPLTIAKAVDIGNCIVICLCGPDGLPPLQMPYAYGADGSRRPYNMLDSSLREEFRNGTVVYEDTTCKLDRARKTVDSEEKYLDNGGTSPIMNTTNPTEQEDGAPAGNQNAAGPHKRKHLSPADKARYTKRIVGQTTSDGVKITGFSGHAFDRVAQRNVSAKRIEAMIRSAKVSPDKKHPNRRCYDVKGSRLVLDHTTGTIVTIEWRNQNR